MKNRFMTMNTFNFKFKTLLLTLVGVLFFGIGEAYASSGSVYSRGRAFLRSECPTGAGKVYVDKSTTDETKEAPATSEFKVCNSTTTPAMTVKEKGAKKETWYHFFAQPNAGYKFTGWYKPDGSLATSNTYYKSSITSGTQAFDEDVYANLDAYAGFIKVIQMSFVRPENGAFTIKNNGATVADYASFTVDGVVKLTASPEEGYKLRGWYTTTDGGVTKTYVAFGLTYEPRSFTSDVTIGAEFVLDDGQANYWIKGTNILETNLATAITAADTSASKTIVVVSDGVVPAVTYNIPSGVTLLIPYAEEYSLMTSPRVLKTDGASGATSATMKTTTFRKLTLADGATINCSGNICIGGTLASVGGGYCSSFPTGAVGMLDMSKGGTINLKSGANLYAWGYVKGQNMDEGNNTTGCGQINAESGSHVWEFYQVGDWRGGTHSSNLYTNKSSKFFPFQAWTIQNIEVPVTYNDGATGECYWSIYGNGAINTITFTAIANSAAAFKIGSGSTVKKWYDPTTDRVCVEFGGGSTVDAISLSVLGETVTSKDFNLPLPANMKLIFKSGADATIANPIVAHAGSIIEVQAGGKLTLSSSLYLFDQEDWDVYCMKGYYFRTYNSPSIHFNRGNGKSKTNLDDATLIADGEVKVSGNLYATEHGANVTGHHNGKLQYTKLASNTTMVQCTEFSTKVNINIRQANLHNENDTYTKGSVATYKNVNGRWFLNSKSSPKSNKTYDFTYIKSGDVYGTGGTNATVSACYSKDMTGAALCDKWANVRASDCGDWWNGIEDSHKYNYFEENAWHQFIKTSTTVGEGDEAMDIYSGTNGKLYAINEEECDIEEFGDIDNCQYTVGGVQKALIGNEFIQVVKNSDDEAYHKSDAASTYYICFPGCVWKPATKIDGKNKAYTVEDVPYIWYNGAWLAVTLDSGVGLYYTLNATGQKVYYEYASNAWGLAVPVAEVITAAGTEYVYKFSEAITKAQDGGANVTIRLLKNVSIGQFKYPKVENASSNNCTLDLNGFKITSTSSSVIYVNSSSAKVIINDAVGTGSVYVKFNRSDNVINGCYVGFGSLVINGGTFHFENTNDADGNVEAGSQRGVYGVQLRDNTSFVMNGGRIEAVSNGRTMGVYMKNATARINGGEIFAQTNYKSGAKQSEAIGIGTDAANAIIYVNGGTITSESTVNPASDSPMYVYGIKMPNSNVKLYMNGGTVEAKARKYACGIQVGASSVAGMTAILSGGTIKANAKSTLHSIGIISFANTTLSGVRIEATALMDVAYGVWVKSGTTTINEGTYITSSAHSEVAGLRLAGGNLTVNGGEIQTEANNSNYARGIYADAGTLIVNDGTFVATAKTTYAYGIFVPSGKSPSCTVNGGKFMVTSVGGSSNIFAAKGPNRTALTLAGGYYNLTPETTYVADGKQVKDVDPVAEKPIYDAGYIKKIAGAEYTITWKNFDDTELAQTIVPAATVPVWEEDAPTYGTASTTYEFDGWCTAPNNGGDYYAADDLPAATENVTYYAHYKTVVAEVTVSGVTTRYYTGASAWAAINAAGCQEATLRLLSDIENMTQMVFTPAETNATVTVDLNGHHWTMSSAAQSPMIEVNKADAKLIIADNSALGNGYLLNEWEKTDATLVCAQVTAGELAIENGGLRAHNTASTQKAEAVYVATGGRFTATGGAIHAEAAIGATTIESAGKTYIDAGTITASHSAADNNIEGTRVRPGAEVSITGGTFNLGDKGYAVHCFGGTTAISGTPSFTANYGLAVDECLGAEQGSTEVTAHVSIAGGIFTTTGWTLSAKTATEAGYTLYGDVRVTDGKFYTDAEVLDNTSAVGQLQLLGGYYTNNSNSHLADYIGALSTVTNLTVADQPEFGEGYRHHITSKFTVTWIIDGVSTEEKYGYNETPDYGSTPAHSGTDTYEFIGWSPAIAPVTKDVTYTAQFIKYEAEIVETGERYEHFADAWQDAQNMPTATLRVLSNVITSSQMVLNPDSASGAQLMTFDLNNHKIEYTGSRQAGFIVEKVGVTLKIVDNSVEGKGVLWHEGSTYTETVFSVIQVRNATLILESGKLYAANKYISGSTTQPGYGVYVNQNSYTLGGAFYMTGGVIEAHSMNKSRGVYLNGATAEAYISGGEIIAKTYITSWRSEASGLHILSGGKAHVSGEAKITVQALSYPMGIYMSGVASQCTFEGGTLTSISQQKGARGIYAYAGTLTITGGEWNVNSISAAYGDIELFRIYKANVNISGGTFNCTTGTDCYGFNVIGPTKTVTISGNPIFNVQRGVRVGEFYLKDGTVNDYAEVTVNGGTFVTSNYAIKAASAKEETNTYTLTGKVTVNDGRFFASSYDIALTSGAGSMELKGGYYNETDGTHQGQILAHKSSSTTPSVVNETIDERLYKYRLTTEYNITWRAGAETPDNESVIGGTIPTHADLTTYTGTDGKTYFFTGWTPTPAPVYENTTYEATGIAYEAKLKIGTGEWVYYEQFLDAWDTLMTTDVSAADTIVLLNNVTLAEPLTYAPLIDDARSVLDLNNYTLTAGGSSTRVMTVNKADAQLTVIDGSAAAGGKLSLVRTSAEAIQTVWVSAGELIVDGGTVYAENNQNDFNCSPATAVYLAQNATGIAKTKLTFNAGTVEARAIYHAYPVYNYGTVTLNGGELKATATTADAIGLYTLGGAAVVNSSAVMRVDAQQNATGVSTNGFISNDAKTRRGGTTMILGGEIHVSVVNGNGVGLQANATGRQVSGTIYTAPGIILASDGDVRVIGTNSTVNSLQGISTSRWILTDSNTPHAIIGEAIGECSVSGGTYLVEARNAGGDLVGEENIEAVRVYGTASIIGGTFTVNAAKAYGLRIFKGAGTVSGSTVFNVNGVSQAWGIATAERIEAARCDATMANNTASVTVSAGTFNVTATGVGGAADAVKVAASTSTDVEGYAMEGHATISGGVFNVTAPHQLHAIAITGSAIGGYGGGFTPQTATPQATITGGKFKLNKTASESGSYADNIGGGGTKEQVELQGGFYNLSSTLSQFTKGAYYCRELESSETEYGEGYRFTISEATNIKVTVNATDTYYATLDQAFEYAKTQVNPVITLMENSALTERYTLVPTVDNWRCTLDLNNLTLTGATSFDRFLVLNKADMKLTITDNSSDKGGEFNLTAAYAGSLYGIVLTNGELELAGGTLHVENTATGQPVCGVKTEGTGTFTQSGGLFEVNHAADGAAQAVAVGGTAAFGGGEVVVTSTGTTACVFSMEAGGTLNITDGKFNGGTQIIANAGTGTANIGGGYYSNDETGLSGLLVSPYTLLATTDADKATVGAAYNWKVEKQFTIRFIDDDWTTVLLEVQVSEGETPVYAGTPVKPDTEYYIYSFSGWTPDIVPADDNKDYYAQYTATARVAKVDVGGAITYYTDLQEAFNYAANNTNPTITILHDVTGITHQLAYQTTKTGTTTIDLNGHTISGSITTDRVTPLNGTTANALLLVGTNNNDTINKIIHITDNSAGGGGKISHSVKYSETVNALYHYNSMLKLSKITVEATNTYSGAAASRAVNIRYDRKAQFTNCTFKATGIGNTPTYGVLDGGSTTYDGCSITVTTGGSGTGIHSLQKVSTINNTTVDVTGKSNTRAICVCGQTPGTGSSTSSGTEYNGFVVVNSGTFTVHGNGGTVDAINVYGNIKANDQIGSYGGNRASSGVVIVNGGTFNVYNANKAGSIGAMFVENVETANTAKKTDGTLYPAKSTANKAIINGGKFNIEITNGNRAFNANAPINNMIVQSGYYSDTTNFWRVTAPAKNVDYWVLPTTEAEREVEGEEYLWKVREAYVVTFKSEDGTETLQTGPVEKSTAPIFGGAEPTKAATAEWTYTFDGWSATIGGDVVSELPAVTAAVTYYAHFSAVKNSYDITWLDGDGNTLKTDNLLYGTLPAYSGETPTKTATAQYTYTFNNTWEPAITSVTGEVTYTAQFDATENNYTVTWKNYDDAVLETDTDVPYGTTPSYDGETPTKPTDAEYTYTFSGWNPAISSVTGDVIYTAQFDAADNVASVDVGGAVTYHTDLQDAFNFAADKTAPTITLLKDVTGITTQLIYQPTVKGTTTIDLHGHTISGSVTTDTPVKTQEDKATAKNTLLIMDSPATSNSDYIFEITDNSAGKGGKIIQDVDVNAYAYALYNNDGEMNVSNITIECTNTREYKKDVETSMGTRTCFVRYNRRASFTGCTINATGSYRVYGVEDAGVIAYENTTMNVTETKGGQSAGILSYQNTSTVTNCTFNVSGKSSARAFYVMGQKPSDSGTTYNGKVIINGGTYTINGTNAISAIFIEGNINDSKNKASSGQVTVNDGTFIVNSSSDVNVRAIYIKEKQTTAGGASTANKITVNGGKFQVNPKTASAALGLGYDKAEQEFVELKSGYYSDTVNFYKYVAPVKAVDYYVLPTTEAEREDIGSKYRWKVREAYVVTFMNEDGTETLQSGPIEKSTAPVFGGETPTKEATAEYTYTFDGWSTTVGGDVVSPLPSVTAAVTYYAHFTATKNSYDITWIDGDGNTLKTDNLEYGETPAYTGATPTKTATAQYTYTFNNTWEPAITSVTGEATYTAQFDATVNNYSVTWKNWDGTLLEYDATVAYGATPSYDGETPTKEATAEWTYTFTGWEPTVDVVTDNMTYTATYNATKNHYTITWENYDGTVLGSNILNYGETPAFGGETPTKPSTAQYEYSFIGWEPTIATVTGTATYTAQYSESTRSYDIVWKNGSTTLKTDNLLFGATPAYDGATPTKASDESAEYTFDGWSATDGGDLLAEIPTVGGEATYYAHYSTVPTVASVTSNGVTKYFTTFDEAWTYVNTLSKAMTVKLLRDIDVEEAARDIQYSYNPAAAVTCTLDLNNHTMESVSATAQPSILIQMDKNSSTLTITDNSEEKEGKLSISAKRAGSVYCIKENAKGTLNLQAGTLEATNTKQFVSGNGVMAGGVFVASQETRVFNMTGGNIKAYSSCNAFGIWNYGKVNLTGGEIYATDNVSGLTPKGKVYGASLQYGTLTISGSAVVTAEGSTEVYGLMADGKAPSDGGTVYSSTLNVEGGTIYATATGSTAAGVACKAAALEYPASSGSYIHSEGTVNVSGGTINVTAGSNALGVYPLRGITNTNTEPRQALYTYSPRANITGGTFNVTSNGSNAEGVRSYGKTIISGGTFTVHAKVNYAIGVRAYFDSTMINAAVSTPVFNITADKKFATGVRAGEQPSTAGLLYNGQITVDDGIFTIVGDSSSFGVYNHGGSRQSKKLHSEDANYYCGSYASAGDITVNGGTFNVTATRGNAKALRCPDVYTAAKFTYNSVTYPAASATPKLNVNGGFFNVHTTEDVDASAYFSTGTGLPANFVVHGGYYTSRTCQADNNPAVDVTTKHVAPAAGTGNWQIITLTDADPHYPAYTYKVAEGYTITFNNYDGTELQSGLVESGTLPVYSGETPTKPADASYTYTFAGWDSEIVAATAEATYTATFTPEPRTEGFYLDITDWMTDQLTINVTGWEFSGWPYTVNGTTFGTGDRGADRTLTIPYSGEAGDEFTITVVNKDGVTVSQHTYIVPMNIIEPTTLTENPSVNIYVHTTTLTIDADITAKNIYVNANARIIINSGKTLTADSLFLRTDIEQSAELENNGTIAGATKVFYTRIMKSNATYYQFGLPCTVSVPVKEIRLANGTDPKYGGGSGWILRYYDEESRATSGKGSNWVTLSEDDVITGGVGYEIFSAMKYYREFLFPVEIPSPQPTSVPVTYTDGAAGYLDCGWNVLVTPFTHRYDNAQYPEAPVICWMTPDGFEQDIPEVIWPARVFAYQTAKSGSLTFDTQMIVAAPRRVKATAEETRIQWIRLGIEDANGAGDQTSVYSHPTRYDQTYKTGIDVAKQTLTSSHAIIYSLQPYGEMAFAGVADEVLKQGVALTVYSPSAQELTISMCENDWLNRLEKVYLIDNETGMRTDLLMQDYSFDAEAGTTEGRFILQGVFKAPQGTTDIDPTTNDKRPTTQKLIIRDKMYILVNGQLYDVTGKQVKK